MHDGVGTLSPAAPVAAWALQMWEGPSVGQRWTRLWRTTRDQLVRWLQPAVERMGVAELVRLFQANELFERSLQPFARSTYDRADLDAIIADVGVYECYSRVRRLTHELVQTRPDLARAGARQPLPPRVLRDEAVRTRVLTAAVQLIEMVFAVHKLQAAAHGETDLDRVDREVETPPEERATNPCWWAYDAGVPAEIARRLLAGRRAELLLPLIRVSRRNWTDDSLRRAALDWADYVADHAGLVASLPGIAMQSVPADRRMDFEAVMADHREHRARRKAHLERALTRLRTN